MPYFQLQWNAKHSKERGSTPLKFSIINKIYHFLELIKDTSIADTIERRLNYLFKIER